MKMALFQLNCIYGRLRKDYIRYSQNKDLIFTQHSQAISWVKNLQAHNTLQHQLPQTRSNS